MSNHTPGPWEVSKILVTDDLICRNETGSWIHHSRRVTGGGSIVAEVCANEPVGATNFGYPCPGSSAEMLANARLIAAAPDLLEALIELVDLVDDIRAGFDTPDSFTTQPARAAIAKATGETE